MTIRITLAGETPLYIGKRKLAGLDCCPLTVNSRPHPAIVLANHDDLSDLGGREVGETQPNELAGLVQLIDGLEGLGERGSPICGMEIANLSFPS